MPTIRRNLKYWNSRFKWTHQGDEWSDAWGGPEAQWAGSIYPRIQPFIPAKSILEIGPGFGRWTQFLKHYCEDLTVVDLSEKCIAACRERFSADSHLHYYVNDGKSLSMILNKSIDFVFSYDSLVHAEADVLGVYLNQLAQKLTPHGVGFIHHSNIGAYRDGVSLSGVLPHKLKRWLMNRNILTNDGWRAYSMTAAVFERLCESAGLQCISQEIVNWGGDRLIDCFSIFTLESSKWAHPNRVIKNPDFMKEAISIRSARDMSPEHKQNMGRKWRPGD